MTDLLTRLTARVAALEAERDQLMQRHNHLVAALKMAAATVRSQARQLPHGPQREALEAMANAWLGTILPPPPDGVQ